VRTTLTLLAAAALAAPTAPATAQTVTEPSSRVAFPVSLTGADGSRQVLTGTGLRTRTILQVKVYAFGLYVDEAQARTALASYAGQTPEQLAGAPALYDALLRMSFPMTMRLVMTRNVTGEQMSEAFDGALRPRVVAAAGRGMPGGEAALDQFRGYFSVEHLTEGTELLFTCAGGSLHSTVGGDHKTAIPSPALCWALFDVYLGARPISPGGKKTAVSRFPAVLRP
jgi:hypothetical protein